MLCCGKASQIIDLKTKLTNTNRFLINDLANIELEIIELQTAIKILNDNYLKQEL